MKITKILRKPIITEKTLQLAGEQNVYTFEVDRGAGKRQIKQAVEDQFKVKVLCIRVASFHSKTKSRGVTRFKSIVGNLKKKAMVKLIGKDKIDLFELGG